MSPSQHRVTTVDPCRIAPASVLKGLIQQGLEEVFPIGRGSGKGRVTISEPRITEAKCPNLSVQIRAKIKYKKSRGFPQFTTSGNVRLTARVVGKVTRSFPTVTSDLLGKLVRAEVCLTRIQVAGLNLRRVPNWLDDGWIKDWVNREVTEEECIDVTDVVRAYLDGGGEL